MRRFLPVLWSLSLIVFLVACGGGERSKPNASSPATSSSSGIRPGKVRNVGPKPVPDLTLETLKGKSINLADQKGRALLINFWATWCAPCLREIPDLKALYSDLKPKGLTIIGVALDRKGREVVAPFVKKRSINYPIVIDSEGKIESAFGPIPGLPTTILVTPDGKVTKRVVGIFPTEKMRPTLKKMLAGSGSDAGTT